LNPERKVGETEQLAVSQTFIMSLSAVRLGQSRGQWVQGENLGLTAMLWRRNDGKHALSKREGGVMLIVSLLTCYDRSELKPKVDRYPRGSAERPFCFVILFFL
jgi:hypothetical protein